MADDFGREFRFGAQWQTCKHQQGLDNSESKAKIPENSQRFDLSTLHKRTTLPNV
jgi:hypothetical protein